MGCPDVRRRLPHSECRPRVAAFRCEMDPLTKSEAVDLIIGWMHSSGEPCKYVVFPNVDHLVHLRKSPSFRAAYQAASLTLVDGRPVTWALRLLGDAVPEVVSGSDLVPALFDAAGRTRGFTVFLMGAGPGVAERAKTIIHRRWPAVRVVGTYSPPFSFQHHEVELARMVRMVQDAATDLLVIGLGAPKQETWIYKYVECINAKVAICGGAAIDFIAGEKKRAPIWMRQIGCEWLYRALAEPVRLGPRYLKDGLYFPAIILEEALARR